MKRFAVIDLGTNTFTMLIAEVIGNQKFNIVFHERYYIKLAEDGIAKIGEAAYQRALDALLSFKKSIDAFDVTEVRALGTAALRTASNGSHLVDDIFENIKIQVEIIDGDAEANYIYEGVKYVYPFDNQYDLIMDIGGGSVEFIIANQSEKVWAQSFPVGVAVLKKRFHQHEPISEAEVNALENYLTQTLQPLFEAIKENPIRNLVGASGTFDVLERLFLHQRFNSNASIVRSSDALEFCESVIQLNSKERYAHNNIPEERVEMIVVALVLIRFIVQKIDNQWIGISYYAMKEGLMSILAQKMSIEEA
jgi:exopolyphosphatase/guanosine-5'-triphosphate,3'-diphosphate pyrophosphatase